MRNIFIVASFVTLFVTQIAQAEDNDWRQICSKAGSLAENIMLKRQEGVSMQTMMETMKEPNKLIEQVIISAYEKPRYSTEKHQKRSVTDFKDQIYLECVKAGKRRQSKS